MESLFSVYLPMIAASLLFAAMALYGRPQKVRRLFWILAAIIPILVATFRYDNGADYLMYDRMYNSILATGDFFGIKTIEVGFKWLIKICGFFSSNSLILFFVCAVLIIAFYYKGIVNLVDTKHDVILGILLFYVTGTYFDSFNGLRQYIAAAIVFWGFTFVVEGKAKKWIITVCIAALFHQTALIMIPLYLIRKLNFSIKRLLIIIVASWFGGTIAYSLVSYVLQFTRYSYFLTSVEYEIMPTEASTLYISILTVFLIVAVLLHRNNRNSHVSLFGKTELMLNMHVLTLCTVLLSWTVPLMWRVQYYFLPMEMVIVPIGLNLVPNKLARRLMKIVVFIIYFVIVLHGILQNDWFDCVPYKFYFNR